MIKDVLNSMLCRPALCLALLLSPPLLTGAFPAGAQEEKDPAARLREREQQEKERERWQSVEEIFDLLGAVPGGRIADIGAGAGFFTARLARAVGADGRIYAVEIDEKLVAELKSRMSDSSHDNVDVILGEPGDPKLPEALLDGVLIVNAYHEMPEHDKMLEHVRKSLKPGGRFLLSEPFSPSRRNEPRKAQEDDHLLAPELAEQDLRTAGFEIMARNDEFILRRDSNSVEWMILARRPDH